MNLLAFIAAPVVAGVYGDQAVRALERRDEAQEQIEQLEAAQKVNARLLSTLSLAEFQLKDLQTQGRAALPALGRLRGAWSTLSSGMKSIGTTLDQTDLDFGAFLVELEIETAIEGWARLARVSTAFVANAFISVDESAMAQAA